MPRIVKCACGQKVGVAEEDLGARGNCVWCGVGLEVSAENSRIVPALSLSAPKMEVDTLSEVWETVGGAACVRCGEAFKGDWDRNATEEGALCHRCTNRWRPADKGASAILPSPQVHEEVGDFNPAPLITEQAPGLVDKFEDGFRDRFDKKKAAGRGALWERHKGKVWYALFSVVAVVAITLLPLNTFVDFIFSNEAAQAGASLPLFAAICFLVIRFVFAVMIVFVPLFAGLSAVDALPNDSLKNNLIAIGVVSAGLSLLFVFSFIPFYRGLAIIVQLMIIMHIYDMETGAFAKFLLVFIVLTPLMMLAVKFAESGCYGLLAGLTS